MSSPKKHSVLVVDDEAPMRAFLQKLLAREGYAVAVAEDGASALEELARAEYDVVVLDMRLPGMGGNDVLRRVREEKPDVAVMVMTAYPSEEAVIESMTEGAVRFLIKPFTTEEFLRALAGALHDLRHVDTVREGITVRGGFRDWVELTAPSGQEYLDRLENFVDALYDVRLGPTEKEDLKIAISEIASNAMEWGNKRDKDRRIRVSYCLFPEEIVFKVADDGEGFTPAEVPDPGENPVAHIIRRMEEGKRVGGYGMYIVRKVMDKVIYSEKGNVVILSKTLAGRQAASAERGSHSRG